MWLIIGTLYAHVEVSSKSLFVCLSQVLGTRKLMLVTYEEFEQVDYVNVNIMYYYATCTLSIATHFVAY